MSALPDVHSPRQAPHGGTVPPALVVGATLFLVFMAYLVTASFLRKSMPMFEPSPLGSTRVGESLMVDTVTVDASDVDRLRFFDFARGSIVAPPDTAGWDLAFRRFHVFSSAAIANLGPVPFDDVARAPDDGYVQTVFGSDTVNAAIDRWYRYSIMTHQLQPAEAVYAIRTRDRQFAKLEFLSYYCTGMRPGCLTFRYAYQPEGTPQLRR